METIRIGMIGLDTGHVISFAGTLHDREIDGYVPGGELVAGFPGESPQCRLSISRVEGFTAQLRDTYGMRIVESPEAVAEESDAILLTSVDGTRHLELFRRVVAYGKPIFVDKPFATRSADAREMFALAETHGAPVMGASSLRYSSALQEAILDEEGGEILGADTYGPLKVEPPMPGLFFYGIHATEMLYSILGVGCRYVTALQSGEKDVVVVGQWSDGRLGTVRGRSRPGYGAVFHRKEGAAYVPVQGTRGLMMTAIMEMFRGGEPGVRPEETMEIVRFIEAANESAQSGKRVAI